MQSAVAVWAPGRVNLIGEHTDYSGGYVLPAAIQLGLRVQVLTQADAVNLRSNIFGDDEPFRPDGSGPPVRGWTRFGQAVAAELDQLGRPPIGLTATIDSDLPVGAGLSSSAALEVGIALALCAVAEFDVDPLALAVACQRAETRAVGVPCGILDQAACLLGEANSALLLNCATLEHQVVAVPENAVFLVLDSGTSRQLENTGYGQRRLELEQALDRMGVTSPKELSLTELDSLDPLSRRRLRHVITENERVGQFAAALSARDLREAGRLISESHASLRDDYEVSTPQLDELARIAEECGAYGARLLGGGFGGAVLSLVEAETAAEVGAAVVKAFGSKRPPIIARPSRGAHVLTSSAVR